MKKILFATALFAFAFCASAQAAQELPLVGEYVNDAGYLVIAPAAKGQNANYDVAIVDNSRKCNLQIVAGTYKVTENAKTNGPNMHPNAVVAVESQDFPNFSLWPEDEKIRLADDALPFDKLDPACQVFKNNLVFTRK